MVEFFKTIDGRITEINEFSEGCWVNMVHPSSDELAQIAKAAEVEEEFVRAASGIGFCVVPRLDSPRGVSGNTADNERTFWCP